MTREDTGAIVSYRVSIHLRDLHRSFSTEVVDSDHMICATSGHEHATCYRKHNVKYLFHCLHVLVACEHKLFL